MGVKRRSADTGPFLRRRLRQRQRQRERERERESRWRLQRSEPELKSLFPG